DETPEILKNFITGIENQIDHKVKAIKCDNGIKFKNWIMNEFCEMKGIRREFSVARTPQQNGVAERKNRTLIEAARTMLADSKLPTTFWTEAVNTACYVQNRVLVIKPHNKTPYELFLGRKLVLTFMRPFGCHVTIPNTLDHLGNQTNGHASTKANIDAGQAGKKTVPEDEVADDARKKNEVLDPTKECDMNGQGEADNTNSTNKHNTVSPTFTNEFESVFGQEKDAHGNITYRIFTLVSVAGSSYDNLGGSISVNAATLPNGDLPIDPLMPELEDIADLQDTGIFSGAYDDEDVGAEANLNNLETTMNKVWRLVDLPKGKHAIGTKRVYKNKKDKIGIVVRNKARLVTQGYTQEEGIKYDEMDVKSAFLYDTIEEEVYVCQPPSLEDPRFLNKTPIKTSKALLKDEEAEDVDIHLYKSMIGSLIDSPFNLEAFSDSDYAGASLDRISTIGGCQFLGKRLISWQCKKQTIVANSTTKAEYVAVANYCGQCSGPTHLVIDETVYKEWEDRMERAATTASSIEAEQDSEAQTRFEAASKPSNDQPLLRVNTLGSGEDSMKPKGIDGTCCLPYCDQHNLVALLKKIDGSEGFHQIVDFLNASHIRFSLSENPTIYDSHIKQFWQTATVNTLDNGEQEITATVDGHVKIVTIASVRKYLKLADAGGLSSLPNIEIFNQLSLMGLLSSHKRTYITPTFTQKLFSNMRKATKGYYGEETPLFPTMLAIDQPGQGEGSAISAGSQHTPLLAPSTKTYSDTRAQSPVTEPYATAFKKLINRVKSLEDELKFQKSKSKRRRLTLVTSEDEEDLGKYGQNLETREGFGDGQEFSIVAQVSIASTFVSTTRPQRNADTTADDLILAETLMKIRKSATKDKVHQAAQGFTDVEWDDVLARVAADEDFKFFAQQRAEAKRNKPMTPAQQKDYMSNYIKNKEGDNNKEWNSGDDQLRFRWMIYLVVLVDAAESVSEAIRFKYHLASSSELTKSPVLWAEILESSLIGPELVQETTDKVVLLKEKLKAASDRQKSCADNRRKPLEFEVGDRVISKVSPWKGVIPFGKKGKLAPRMVIVKVQFWLEARSLRLQAKLLPVRYLVKVSWNSKGNFELIWVWEDYLKDKYP
ncbi:retrovirus-related pol polyprotein from transposon TNT 1-94, partial [Tanacetum coccineum]